METEFLPTETRPTDDQLVGLVRTGDEVAFEELYRRIEPIIRRIGYRYGVDTNDIDDVAQEVVMQVVANIDKYRPGNFCAWVSTVTRNFVCSLHRKNHRDRQHRYDFALEEYQIPGESDRAMLAIEDNDEAYQILAEVRELSGAEVWDALEIGEIVVDFALGYSQREIAARHGGISRITVATRLHRMGERLAAVGVNSSADLQYQAHHRAANSSDS